MNQPIINGTSSNVDLEIYEKKLFIEDHPHESPEKELNS